MKVVLDRNDGEVEEIIGLAQEVWTDVKYGIARSPYSERSDIGCSKRKDLDFLLLFYCWLLFLVLLNERTYTNHCKSGP